MDGDSISHTRSGTVKFVAPLFKGMVVLAGSALLPGCHGARPAALGVNRRRVEAIRARWGELPSR